jgi:transcriptional regulator GlxA family with amidase domain
MSGSIDVVFALFPRVTQLDFTGPYEVLWRVPGAQVTLASREGGALCADGGLGFGGLSRLDAVERADVLCVPGGSGVTDALLDEEYMRHVRRLGASARYLTSVCTGSLILAGAGLLEGKRAACHWAWRALLAEQGVLVEEARIVRDGRVITGGGVTAGIDFGLAVAAELAGEAAARAIQLAIEYAPEPPFASGRPELATPDILATARERAAIQYPARKAALQAARERQ